MTTTTTTVRTPVLEVALEEHGPPDGEVVMLLHGFPDDVRAYDGVVDDLADDGARVLVPYLRGYGPTRFLDPWVRRTAQQSAIATDVLDLLDALDVDRAVLAGYDWGGRAACIAAILSPERVAGLVTVTGYNVQDTLRLPPPAPVDQARAHWYQWYFATEPGHAGLTAHRREIARALWREWSPTWRFTDAEFDTTAGSFDNDDFVDVVLHSYRHRWGHARGEPRFAATEALLAQRPPITVPTVVLHGAEDTVAPPARSLGQEGLFPRGTPRHVVAGAGHFLPRERPDALLAAVRSLRSAGPAHPGDGAGPVSRSPAG